MEDNTARDPSSPAPVRKKWRVRRALLIFALTIVALVLILPWLLGTPPGRALIVNRVNAMVAPGSVELAGLRLAWTGSIELSGLNLRDPVGKVVVGARRVTIDRGILGLLMNRPDYGRIVVEDARVDVERRVDGTIDVVQALGSIMKAPATPPPAPTHRPVESKLAVVVVIKGGTLKLVSPELVDPILSKSLVGSVTIVPGKPMELVTTLVDDECSLKIQSTVGPVNDRSMVITGKDWPLHVRQSGVNARGRFAGTLEAREEEGLWTVKSDATIVGVEATGPALLGDTLTLDRVVAFCNTHQTATGWSIGKLDLTSPVATIQGGGAIPAIDGEPTVIQGRVDLAALAKMMPKAMRLRVGLTLDKGNANVRASLSNLKGVEQVQVVASLDDFEATEEGRPVRLREAVGLTAQATRIQEKVSVQMLEVKAAGIDVTTSGDLETGVKLAGTIDTVALMTQIRDILDLGAFNLSGHARVAADYRHAGELFKGRFAADCKDLKITGMTAEPIVRDLVRLDASILGAVRPDAVPNDWQEARVNLQAGDLRANLIATSKDSNVTLVAGLGLDVVSPLPGRLEAQARFQRAGQLYDIEALRLGLTPIDPKGAGGVVGLAIRGRIDLASGEGTFTAIPDQAVGAIGLGAGGAKVTGAGRADLPMRIDADLVGDLGALDRLLATWSDQPIKGLGGAWSSQIGIGRSVAGLIDVDAKASVPNIITTSINGLVDLAFKGEYSTALDRLEISNLNLLTEYGQVVVVANVLETKGRQALDLSGKVQPNWATIDPIIARSVKGTARFRANVRPIRLSGSLKHDTIPQLLGQLQGELGLDLTQAEALGVKVAPTPVVLKIGGGQAKFDPIRTTMNNGPVAIQGSLALDKDNGVWLRLGPSRIDNAAINEAVSTSILAYVAPVLAKSTEVSGKVSLALNKALVPITGLGGMSLDGTLALKDTVFKPGPLGAELTSITGQAAPQLKIDQAMTVQVANGRVQQNGLAIPIGGDGFRVAIDGSVGFDDTLDLTATVPLTAKALGLDSKLDKNVAGTKLTLPVGGTLSRPAIDRKGLNVALRNAARTLGEKQLKDEAGRMIDRLASPKSGGTEPRTKPGKANPLGELENLGRGFLEPKKP